MADPLRSQWIRRIARDFAAMPSSQFRSRDAKELTDEIIDETLDEADRALRVAETPELPIGQAIGLSLAREVIANVRWRMKNPEGMRDG